MKSYLSKNRYCVGQDEAIKTYGEKVWSWTCDNVKMGHTFTISFIRDNCKILQCLSQKTKSYYIAAVLNNIIKEYEVREDIPKDQNCPIEKLNRNRFLMKK